ncbi:hypothetical protein [Mycoplasma sp. 1654_15]|uniref:hypothetical protein n=1 Tax=Mycoplasma sp. 1654_15 TaxID=2725994 RepID=UPI0020C58CF2|nr:hypothetical protein [Mycoplasma sp. 1654_15]
MNSKQDSDYFIKEYWNFIEKLNRPILPFNKLEIKKYVNNYQIFLKNNLIKIWFYHRHHIDEINISGAILKNNKQAYKEGKAILVNYKEHAFLHYLIVCAQTTSPNFGFLSMIDFETWDEIAREFCKQHNIKYIENWRSFLN